MNELPREALIVISVMFGTIGLFIFFNIIYFVIKDIQDRKKQPKIEDLQRQLYYSKAQYRSISEAYDNSYEEHKALALAVMLCKENNLNLKQLEELGLQRYNALQTRNNFISDVAYEELVKNHIIYPEKRRSYTDGIDSKYFERRR